MNKFLIAALALIVFAGCDNDDDDNPTPGTGCNSAPLMLINTGDTIILPNAFTPNGDGRNEVYRFIHGTDDSLSGTMTIFQQGTQIFTTSEINSGPGWNGINNVGVVLPEGDFQVQLKLNLSDGGTYEDTRCLRLINPGVSGCIDTTIYRFADQYQFRSDSVEVFPTREFTCR